MMVALLGCQTKEKEVTKIDKANLKMSLAEAEQRFVNQEFLEMRCDCDDYITNFLQKLEQDTAFEKKYIYMHEYLQKALNARIDILPPVGRIHQRVQSVLSQYQNNSSYQSLANWGGYGIIKAYFLRIPTLNNEQKQILGWYVNLLIEQKNMNLSELADALEKLENYWTKPQIAAAAQTILANEAVYNQTASNPEIRDASTTGLSSQDLSIINMHKEILDEDELARIKLHRLAHQ